jgi:pimeloyl-ACP methyl ester carboxylesterase
MDTLTYVVILVVLGAALAPGALILGLRARRAVRQQTPPPGRMVDIGGYHLHVNCVGSGGPVVVLDPGIGEFSSGWAEIQRELAGSTTVCAYDRAGLGWSEQSHRPRTVEVMVDELHTLLTRSGLPAPFILVGATFGGLLVRVFAHQYPELTAGLVLIDATHERQFEPEPIHTAVTRMSKLIPIIYGIKRAMVSVGATALFPSLAGIPSYITLPEPERKVYSALVRSRPAIIATQAAELSSILESHRQARERGITDLGNIPLIVLRHGRVQPQLTPELTDMVEALHVELQAELASQSPSGCLVVAEHSGHAIQYDEPQMVIRAVEEVVFDVRRRLSEPTVDLEHASAPSVEREYDAMTGATR